MPKNILDATNERAWPLTDLGREQAQAAAALVGKGITKIFSSPFARTKETAEIVARELGLDPAAIVYDDRLRELNFGELDGTSYDAFIEVKKDAFLRRPIGNGESYTQARERFGSFIYELESSLQVKACSS
jgi:broad specificity phosphatase PhoE